MSGVTASSEFLDDVLAGLSLSQKAIPGKYLWDEAGSLLFDRICETADYYPTGRETAILRREAAEIARLVGPRASLVEFGSGASHKVRILLDALAEPRRYVAIDISGELLASAASRIAGDYPGVEVVPVCADYSRPLSLPLQEGGPRQDAGPVLGFFPGIAIGNFATADVVAFLARARTTLGKSWFLIGADPNRDQASLSRAYGGTLMAAFHSNLLSRLVREAGGELDPGDFRHEIRVLADPRRVEAHLVAKRQTTWRIGGRAIHFEPGESIRTDTSYKHAPEFFQGLASRAGWQPVRCWLDADGLSSLHLLRG